MTTRLLALLGAALVHLLAGCAARPGDPGEPTYIYVTLRTGPRSGEKSAEERETIFDGHMANMHRLAASGDLLIAGPFDGPTDPTWRGLLVLNASDAESAAKLVATDPGVASGVFAPELTRMRASPRLRLVPDLVRERDARQPPPTAGPRANIRAYVLVTAEDVEACLRGLNSAGTADKVVWSGRFLAPREHAGVIVLDAADPKAVRADLAPHSPGPIVVDGWWSDSVLTQLPLRR